MPRDHIKRLAVRLVLALGFGLCAIVPTLAQSSQETVFWESVRDSGSPEQLQLYISRFPDGVFRDLAELKLSEMQGAATAVTQSAQQDCDLLAGHQDDETLPVAPTAFDDLQAHVDEALAACKAAHESGADPRYTFQYARALLADGQESRAFDLYQQAADAGHLRAAFRVGVAYEHGRYGVPKNRAKALAIYEANAARGHADSAFEAGWLLGNALEGDGFERDHERAHKYYLQAEAAGVSDVFYPLGFMYEKGQAVEQDVDKAIAYYRQSIAKTDFFRGTVRKRLSDLLAARFETLWRDDIAGREALFPEIVQLLVARAGSDRQAHDYAVERAVWGLTQMYLTALASTTFGDNDLARGYGGAMQAMSGYLVEAMNARAAAFPEAFAAQSAEARTAQVAQLLTLFGNVVDEYAAFDAFRAYAKEKDPMDCLSVDSVWRDTIFDVRFSNSCRHAVFVELKVVITYPVSHSANDVEYEDETIAADDTDTITVWSTGEGRRNAAYEWRACFARDGMVDEESNWNRGQFRCAQREHHSDPTLERARQQVVAEAERILAGA